MEMVEFWSCDVFLFGERSLDWVGGSGRAMILEDVIRPQAPGGRPHTP